MSPAVVAGASIVIVCAFTVNPASAKLEKAPEELLGVLLVST
jgi:hypothetical protein